MKINFINIVLQLVELGFSTCIFAAQRRFQKCWVLPFFNYIIFNFPVQLKLFLLRFLLFSYLLLHFCLADCAVETFDFSISHQFHVEFLLENQALSFFCFFCEDFKFGIYSQIWCWLGILRPCGQILHIALHESVSYVLRPTRMMPLISLFIPNWIRPRSRSLIVSFQNKFNTWRKPFLAGAERLIDALIFDKMLFSIKIQLKLIRKHIFQLTRVHNWLIIGF